jgi:hypothetical protein
MTGLEAAKEEEAAERIQDEHEGREEERTAIIAEH